ncbi:MAG: NAD/NADP octopine/nopaline dehydrogenase family protein [Synergistaceae bacterium]|jgi:opine dehydrogenase|nr:NAD/NADP octopine/nopaline dehydrogenase family protein [Synergistaceae bacterium]
MGCKRRVIVAGANSIPFGTRISNNSSVNQVCILYRQTLQTMDTFPSSDWDDFWKVMKDFEPYAAADVKHGDTMLGVNFDNLNPVIHVPAVVLTSGTIDNWGIIEDVGSPAVYYNIYRHAFSPSVASVQYAFYRDQL